MLKVKRPRRSHDGWRRALCLSLFFSLAAIQFCLAQEKPGVSFAIKLRPLVPGVTGSLRSEPTERGGKVRLTVMGLPRPGSLSPGAQTYVVWATAPGAPPIRVGELRLDVSGNGGLEFERPEAFENYSVLVTAEPDAGATAPSGAIVLASPPRVVKPLFGSGDRPLSKAAQRRMLEREVSRSVRYGRRGDFYAEVNNAIESSPGGGRLLELVGAEMAPDAFGTARVAVSEEKGYARAVFINLPPPSAVGANTYVLWGVLPEGRIIYMGSLPVTHLNNSNTFVRVGGFDSDEFLLFVTAERRRPAARPSGQRALTTREQ